MYMDNCNFQYIWCKKTPFVVPCRADHNTDPWEPQKKLALLFLESPTM